MYNLYSAEMSRHIISIILVYGQQHFDELCFLPFHVTLYWANIMVLLFNN